MQQGQQGKENILVIPVEDKEKLQELMQKLFAEDSFAYTILGNFLRSVVKTADLLVGFGGKKSSLFQMNCQKEYP